MHACEQFIYLFTFNTSVSFRKQNLAEGYMKDWIMNKMKITRIISFWCPKKDCHYAGQQIGFQGENISNCNNCYFSNFIE